MNEYINKTKFEELMHKKSRNYFDLYYADKIREHYNKAIGYSLAADEALAFPAEDVQPVKRGKWIEQDMYYVCSNCKHEFLNDILGIAIWGNGVPYFCPNCGADMSEPEIRAYINEMKKEF